MITLTIWHNVATDAQGRHAGMLDGYQPGNPMVRVFAYQADLSALTLFPRGSDQVIPQVLAVLLF